MVKVMNIQNRFQYVNVPVKYSTVRNYSTVQYSTVLLRLHTVEEQTKRSKRHEVVMDVITPQ